MQVPVSELRVRVGLLAKIFALVLLAWPIPQASATIQSETSAPIFRFHTDSFWLNLHHFLYVLGRAGGGTWDTEREAVRDAPVDQERGLEGRSSEEVASWREAVAAYAEGPSQLDPVFDDELFTATRALAGAGDDLAGVEIDPAWREALAKAAPIYREVWWPEHRAANVAWVEALEPLLEEHGDAVLEFVTRAYGQSWPSDGYPVELSGYSNWAGAYSTTGPLLVISSLDESLRGTLHGLEITFHEASHQWDEAVQEALIEAAKAEETRFGGGLTHALIWATVGEAVRRLEADYIPYAEEFGLWQRRMGVFRPAIEAGWMPYLRGSSLGDDGARRAALRALMRTLRNSG